ncbi:MAG: hypothetical protein AB9903_13945 [Vulcanimicrobiota bacterium]
MRIVPGEKAIINSDAGFFTDKRAAGGAVFTIGEFWSWAFSDLQDNMLRGEFAEFIVARALGIDLHIRQGWTNYDLETEDGIRIEVKTSAFLQSWDQNKLSDLKFSGLKARAWNPIDGYDIEKTYRADVYVFCVQKAKTHEEYDQFDLSQWEFRVVPRKDLECLGVASLSYGSLCRICPEKVSYSELREAVYKDNERTL